jgi:hypothetical protein
VIEIPLEISLEIPLEIPLEISLEISLEIPLEIPLGISTRALNLGSVPVAVPNQGSAVGLCADWAACGRVHCC